ncbi:MAG: glycosyltransferase [Chlorobiales bacterium]|nr:glycosyltransferase [Chlorobiales bacterium]
MGKVGDDLVSVIVITYKSAAYVTETLESVKRQSYPHIELIITDDGSRDDTIEVCRKWIEDNRSRFTDARLVTTPVNTGVPSNCNRGWRAATGPWLKFIAGDDILLDHGIEEFVRYAKTEPDASFIAAGIIPFDENGDREPEYTSNALRKSTSEAQFTALLRDNCMMPAPALFVKKALLEKIGGFDERYSMLEDVPFYVKTLASGYKFYFLDKPLVRYRSWLGSIVNSSDNRHSEQVLQFSKDYVIPLLIRRRRFLLCWHILVFNFSIEKSASVSWLFDNTKLRNMFWLAVDPLYWLVFLSKMKRRASRS